MHNFNSSNPQSPLVAKVNQLLDSEVQKYETRIAELEKDNNDLADKICTLNVKNCELEELAAKVKSQGESTAYPNEQQKHFEDVEKEVVQTSLNTRIEELELEIDKMKISETILKNYNQELEKKVGELNGALQNSENVAKQWQEMVVKKDIRHAGDLEPIVEKIGRGNALLETFLSDLNKLLELAGATIARLQKENAEQADVIRRNENALSKARSEMNALFDESGHTSP